MNCEKYVWRSLAKMFDCNKIYGNMIFPAIAHLDTAEGFETKVLPTFRPDKAVEISKETQQQIY